MLKMIRQWLHVQYVSRQPALAATDVAHASRDSATAPDANAESGPQAVRRHFSGVMLGVAQWRDLPPNAFERLVLNELAGLQTAWHEHEQLLPRLPNVLPELLRTLRNADATLGELVTIVARDPALVAAVTRTVNSVWFRSTQPVTRLRDAVLLLGHDGLRQLLPTVAMQPIFHAGGGRFQTLAGPHVWAHAQRCALAGMTLADGKPAGAPFEHYLAGMTLGASLVIVARTLDTQRAADLPLRSTHFVDAMLRESRGLAVRVAAQWEFPPGTVAALEALCASACDDAHCVMGQAEYLAMARALVHGGRASAATLDVRAHLPHVSTGRLRRCESELLRFDEGDVPY